jgi:putative Holliday junction resolvase
MSPSNILCLEDLAARLGRNDRLLGLDLGTKTIGIAISDTGRSLSSAHSTIRRTKFREDAASLAQLVAENGVAGLILGLPLNMDGSEGPRAQSTRTFARNLAAVLDVPIAFWDERLSTAAAERTLLEADVSRKRRAQVIDKMAAAFILQGALDRLRHL